jgi:hypothetical protein
MFPISIRVQVFTVMNVYIPALSVMIYWWIPTFQMNKLPPPSEMWVAFRDKLPRKWSQRSMWGGGGTDGVQSRQTGICVYTCEYVWGQRKKQPLLGTQTVTSQEGYQIVSLAQTSGNDKTGNVRKKHKFLGMTTVSLLPPSYGLRQVQGSQSTSLFPGITYFCDIFQYS